MSWQLTGTYFENCSCDMVCPCTTSGLSMPADHERCRGLLAFHVQQGEIEGVEVDKRSVVVVFDTPPIMNRGDWRVGIVMDQAASAEQAAKLRDVFS